VVAEYFHLLSILPDAPRGTLANRKRLLDAKIDRGEGSIDFKLGNITHVATQLGLPPLKGFKAAPKAQDAIYPAIDRYLTSNPQVMSDERFLPRWTIASAALTATPGFLDMPSIFVDEAPPPPGASRTPRPAGLERLVRKFDPVARDFRNRSLGKAGEALIVDFERRRLEKLDRRDLASKVRWVAQEDGDGAGYDIHSYDRQGNDRLIEVKTTQGVRSTPFFLTRNELSLAHERPEHFRLYRLYEVARAPRLFKLKPPLEEAVTLEAETWRARVG
jgi:hypothetical protein